MLSELNIRKAKVEDHDDLLPLLHETAHQCPSLATLPESCLPEEPFALSRLIDSQASNSAFSLSWQGS